jgi:hypothetical protein
LSQLVDCVAYCVRRKFRDAEVDDYDRQVFSEFFGIIEPKFLKNGSTTKGYGLKTFPDNRNS